MQLILRILLKWSFAFLHSSKLSNHFNLWPVITLWSWDVIHKSTSSLFFCCWFSQQLHSILPSKFFSFHSLIVPEALFVSSRQVSFHPLKFIFYTFHVQSEFCLNPFSLIRFLSCSNRSCFIVFWFRELSILVILVVPLFFSSALDSLLLLLISCFTSSCFSSVSVLRSRDEISC